MRAEGYARPPVARQEPSSHQGRAYTSQEIEALLRQSLTDLMKDGTPFRDLSVERLRKPAGVSRSSFYVYFKDKADLLRALEAGSLEELYDSQRGWLGRGTDVTREDIESGMNELFDRYLEYETVFRAIAEASTYEPTVREQYITGVRNYARSIARLIKQLQADGRCGHLDPSDTGQALAWMTERTVLMCAGGSTSRRRASLAKSLSDVIWSTLSA
jgi:TetR/AcrR family transcriptional regulator, ethionamide resistance regulator